MEKVRITITCERCGGRGVLKSSLPEATRRRIAEKEGLVYERRLDDCGACFGLGWREVPKPGPIDGAHDESRRLRHERAVAEWGRALPLPGSLDERADEDPDAAVGFTSSRQAERDQAEKAALEKLLKQGRERAKRSGYQWRR